MTKEILIEQLNRKLELVRRAMNTWEDSADMAVTFYNQAFGMAEFACCLVQDSPDLEKEILELWDNEYSAKFKEIIWG